MAKEDLAITFTSLNTYGEEKEYSFRSVAALKEEYCSPYYELPYSDDPIWDVKIKGIPVRINTFYNLLKLVGIIS